MKNKNKNRNLSLKLVPVNLYFLVAKGTAMVPMQLYPHKCWGYNHSCYASIKFVEQKFAKLNLCYNQSCHASIKFVKQKLSRLNLCYNNCYNFYSKLTVTWPSIILSNKWTSNKPWI